MKQLLNILVLGNGARESALVWKLRQSPRVERIYMAPRAIPGTITAPINPLDFEAVEAFVEAYDIDMVIPGHESAVVAGIADALKESKVKVIAPDAACARLEGSKEFAKEFMSRHSIPTSRFMTVTPDWLEEGMNFLNSLQPPYVLKADGLAHGEGVIICKTLEEAKSTLTSMLDGMFGEASSTVIIEEFVDGRECSMFLAVDGEDYIFLPDAKDYKKIGEGNTGPNTAGMGAVSPVPFLTDAFRQEVERRIVRPTLKGLKEEGLDYRGFLFLGLMELEGEPVLIEYNARLGAPETEAVMPRISSDFVDILEGIADRTLALKRLEVNDLCSTAVVLSAKGYPAAVTIGDPISGMASASEECLVLPGALRFEPDGTAITDGGRVLTVTGLGSTHDDSLQRAMAGAALISYPGKYYRKDIGSDIY